MNIYLVNTNNNPANGNPNGYKYMLREGFVATYYGNKTDIDVVRPGDMVLLYHNDNRIIAVGFVLSGVNPRDFWPEEHFAHVKWVWKVNFNESFAPLNPIMRDEIHLSTGDVRRAVENISSKIQYDELWKIVSQKLEYCL